MKSPYSELKLSGQTTGETIQNPSTRPNGVYDTRGDSVATFPRYRYRFHRETLTTITGGLIHLCLLLPSP